VVEGKEEITLPSGRKLKFVGENRLQEVPVETATANKLKVFASLGLVSIGTLLTVTGIGFSFGLPAAMTVFGVLTLSIGIALGYQKS